MVPQPIAGVPSGVFADNRAPTGKLRTVFPVLIERVASVIGNRYCRLPDTPSFGGVESESSTGSQVQTVVGRVAGKEGARADSKIIQSIMHRMVKIRCCARSQAVADAFEVSTRNNQEMIFTELQLPHCIHL